MSQRAYPQQQQQGQYNQTQSHQYPQYQQPQQQQYAQQQPNPQQWAQPNMQYQQQMQQQQQQQQRGMIQQQPQPGQGRVGGGMNDAYPSSGPSSQQITPQYRTPQQIGSHGLMPQQQQQMMQQQQGGLMRGPHNIAQPQQQQQQYNPSAQHSPMSHQSFQSGNSGQSLGHRQPQHHYQQQQLMNQQQQHQLMNSQHQQSQHLLQDQGMAHGVFDEDVAKRSMRSALMQSIRSANLIEDILGPVDLEELSPANQEFSHPVLTEPVPQDIFTDDDQLYLPGSRLPPRHAWSKQTFFPKSIGADQKPSAFNTGVYYTGQELVALSPRFLDEYSLSTDPHNPSQTPQIQTLQSRSGNDARLPQFVLPEGHFPVQTQFSTLSNDNIAPSNSALSISPMHYTARPNVTVPFQAEHSAGLMTVTEYKAPDPEATLLGQIRGIKPRPPEFSAFTAGSVLLDVPEAGRRALFSNYDKLAASRPYYTNYLYGGSEDPGLNTHSENLHNASPTSTSTTMDDTSAPDHYPTTLLGLPAPPLKHYFGPYDIIKRKVIHIGNDRQELYLQAKLAETAERWGDMALATRQAVIHCNGRVSREERSLFILAHKQLLLPLRQAIRVCRQPFPTEAQRDLATSFGAHLQYQLITLTKSLVQFTVSICLRATLMTAENHIVFLKFCGDLYRYIAESAPNFFDAARLTRAYYHDAALLSERYLSISNPIRLGLLLNYSVAAFELFRDPKTACEMISWSFDKAIARMDELSQRDFNESVTILQLMRDNMLMWTAMLQGTALYLIENNNEAGIESTKNGYNVNVDNLNKYDQPLVEVSASVFNGQFLINPIDFPSAFDIQLAHSFPHRSPIELPINNKNSHMIPRSMHLAE